MRIERRYVANDGTEFKNEKDCRTYEDREDFEKLKDYIEVFDLLGNPIKSFDGWWKIGYVRVRKTFETAPEEIVYAWERVWDSELDDLIAECGEGWYFHDDDDKWHHWITYAKEFEDQQEQMYKMSVAYD